MLDEPRGRKLEMSWQAWRKGRCIEAMKRHDSRRALHHFKVTVSLLLHCRVLHHFHILGGVFLEVLEAGLAAEVHVGALVGDFDWLAHLATKGFVRDDAFFERVGGGDAFRSFALSVGGIGEADAENSGGEEGDEFHVRGCVVFSLLGVLLR